MMELATDANVVRSLWWVSRVLSSLASLRM